MTQPFLFFAPMALTAIVMFVVWNLRQKNLRLIHKLYVALGASYGIWVLAVLMLQLHTGREPSLLRPYDAMTYSAGSCTPILYLLITLTFINSWEVLPSKCRCLFLFPIVTTLVAWTDPVTHLLYVQFSSVKSEIIFGPYMYVSGLGSYLPLVIGIALMIRFILKAPSQLYLKQGLLFCLSGIVPLLVSCISTFSNLLPITATPMSFIVTLFCNGIAIYSLHMLDIKPIATQQILERLSDCYLILSDKGLVINYNRPFSEILAADCGISESTFLSDSVKQEDIDNRTALYNLMTAVKTCGESLTTISYEQAVTGRESGQVQKRYYVAEITPLVISGRLSGFVAVFKDVTQLKKSMERLQSSQNRMMEQERLAFLGQMIGGLAHNLKTPIMSISGGVSAAEALVEEIRASLGDPEVTEEDYREICDELNGWSQKIMESTAYMSDIITAIKGQAATAADVQTDAVFTVGDVLRRTVLLMRHALTSGGCKLIVEAGELQGFSLHGDINCVVQVLNNFVDNAIYAQRDKPNAEITLTVEKSEESIRFCVKDRGPGVSPEVRRKLFREMVTNKGAQGTGLGLYISQALIRGNFGGSVWLEDNPGGGAVFGFTIPLEQDPGHDSEQHPQKRVREG